MELIVVYLLEAKLTKFIIIALALVILVLAFVIVLLNVYIMNLHKEMYRKEKSFKRALQNVRDEERKKREEDDLEEIDI